MPTIGIPPSQRLPLQSLLRLDADRRSALLDCIQRSGATVVTGNLKEPLAAATGLSGDDVAAVLDMLLGIYWSHTTQDLNTQLLVKTIESDPEILTDAADTHQLPEFFDRLFGLKSLGLLSKAYRLSREHANPFCTADIVTDLRPVFDDVEAPPVAAAIVHSLRIAYHKGPGLDVEEFFVGLDRGHLEDLLQAIQRALTKDARLREFADRTQLAVLATEE